MADNQEYNSGGDKRDDKNAFDKLKQNTPKFNFNIYWIYGIIIMAIIAVNFFVNSIKPKEISWKQFSSDIIANKDIDHLKIVAKSQVHIYIKKDRLNNENRYKDVRIKPISGAPNEGPHYFFNIGDIETFNKELAETEAKYNYSDADKVDIIYDNNTEANSWETLLWWAIIITSFIILWSVVMKRMGGGGAGGQIFNIGKSRAQLFDKDLHVKGRFLQHEPGHRHHRWCSQPLG